MKRVRKIADKFAISMKISKLPLEPEDLEEIARTNGWSIVPYSKGFEYVKAHNLEEYYYTSNGFTYASSDGVIIFIKDELNYLEKIDVLCHEIGHLVLGHIAIGTKQKQISIENINNAQELEADVFALVLQAPTYLMQTLGITTKRSLIEKGIFKNKNAKLRRKYYLQDIPIYNIVHKILLGMFITVVVVSVFTVTKTHYNNNERTIAEPETTAKTTNLTEISTEELTEITSTALTSIETVYTTKTGSKYHKPSCFHIKNRKTISMSLSDAEVQGYFPCSDCFNNN